MEKLKRILLIDDDVNTNFYNRILFEQAKVCDEILEFQNAEEGLDFLKKENEVSLVLLDINMPIMNGWQFLEAYEQLNEKQKEAIIVVMLTSSINMDDQEKAAMYDSVKKFIRKPISPELINEIMELFHDYAI